MSPNEPVSATTTRPAPPPPPAPTGRDPVPVPAEPRPPDGGRPLGWGLTLIAIGGLWLLSQAGVSIRWELVLPGALILVGVLLLAGGRWVARGGLIGLGVLLTIVALAVSTTPAPTAVSAGEREHVITDVGDLESRYGLGAGSMTIDLRGLDLPEGATELSAGVSMGELIVRVPPGVAVEGEGGVVMGEVAAFGHTRGGIMPRLELDEAGDDASRVLALDLQVGLGQIEVTR